MAAASLGLVGLVPLVASALYDPAPRETWSANNTVFAITVTGDRTYLGGQFTSVKNLSTSQTVTRTRLAALQNSTGALVTSFNATINGNIRAIAVSADGDTVYIAGEFTTVNGAPRTRLAALDADDGSLRADWNPSASGLVRDMIRVDGQLYLAGTFGKVNNVSRPGLAKLDAATGQLTSWKVTNTGGRPRSITVAPNGTDLVVGGSFSTLASQPRAFLGSVSLATGAVTTWTPPAACLECDVFDVSADATAVYGAIGGGGGRAVKWSATSDTIIWSKHSDGNAQAIDVADGVVYVGGHFGPNFAGQPRGQLAAVSAASGALTSFAPDLGTEYYPGVWAIDAGTDFLRVGGGFRSVNGIARARYAEFPVQ